MKIGIVGYQGSGKSTLFEWLTGVKPDPALAMFCKAPWRRLVPEPRVMTCPENYCQRKSRSRLWNWSTRLG